MHIKIRYSNATQMDESEVKLFLSPTIAETPCHPPKRAHQILQKIKLLSLELTLVCHTSELWSLAQGEQAFWGCKMLQAQNKANQQTTRRKAIYCNYICYFFFEKHE